MPDTPLPPPVATVFLRGEFDLARGREILDRVHRALAASATNRLAIDLADATFFDCYSIGRLVLARQHAARQGVTAFVIHVDHPMVHRVLEITGVLPTMRPPAPEPTAAAEGHLRTVGKSTPVADPTCMPTGRLPAAATRDRSHPRPLTPAPGSTVLVSRHPTDEQRALREVHTMGRPAGIARA
jgi:anti-anti-sigma factor